MTSTDYEILICDDHPICQLGIELSLRSVLKGKFNARKATTGQELLSLVSQKRSDLIILDLGLPDISGTHLIRSLRELSLTSKIMIITSCEDFVILQNAINAGVDALLAKTHSLETLALALQSLSRLNQNEPFIDAAIQQLMAHSDAENLTPREWEVLELIARGRTNRDIADHLDCSLETVKTHRANLGRKIFARNRAELTAWYLQRERKANSGFKACD